MGSSGNRDCQWASRGVLKDFTEHALTISVGRFYRRGHVALCLVVVRMGTPWAFPKYHG